MSENRSLTLATANDQTLFILDGTRVGDVRVSQDQIMQTVIQRWGTGGGNVPAIMNDDVFIRRLTPVECERLQGFPDDYTNIKEKCPDGSRYKAVGNSMAVPVMKWIGNRIKENDNGFATNEYTII